MKREKVYKNVKNGSLIKVKNSYGVVLSSRFDHFNIDFRTNDPYVYTADINGCECLLIREAFELIQEP